MRLKTFYLLLALSLLFLSRTTVFADGEEDEEVYDEEDEEDEEDEVEEDDEDVEEYEEEYDDDDGVLSASADVQTFYMFLDYPEERITIGENVTLLLGFANKGDSTFNASKIVVALHSPYDYNYYIKNFTTKELNGTTIGPQNEVSLVFNFGLEEKMEAMEYHMSAYIDYNSTDDSMYRSTFLNKSIEFVEPHSAFDVKNFFMIVLGLCVLALIGYYLLLTYSPKTLKGKGKKLKKFAKSMQNTPERGTEDAGGDIDDFDAWASPMYVPKKQSKVKKSRNSLRKKKKKKGNKQR